MTIMNRKRLFAILMVLVLLVASLPLAVSAASDDSVDHIDIGVTLYADIMIDGKLYENQKYTLAKSDLNADALSITANKDVEFSYSLSRISSSTDKYGNQQHRISGDFPVGTYEDPVVYTMTLDKTVSVTTDNGVVQVPVTFSASFGYWDEDNVCPGLGRDWSNGSVSRGSGLDFVLGNGEGSATTHGTITVQKTVEGMEATENMTFIFDIYTADGELYATVEATVTAESPYATTTLGRVPFGTYTVVERAADVDGYTVETTYSVSSVTVSESAPSQTVYVTNIYTEVEAETTVPETTIPETTVPETTVPETTVPETTVPETTVPETTEPEVPEATEPVVDDPVIPEVPATGTMMGALAVVTLLSGAGLAGLALTRKNDNN